MGGNLSPGREPPSPPGGDLSPGREPPSPPGGDVAGSRGAGALPLQQLDELCARFALTDPARDRLALLLELLVEDPHAPTAVRDPLRALNDHLADSLVALELEPVRAATAGADLGSGAGLPGLPLAIALAPTPFQLIESARRKCDFLEHAAEHCGLDNVRVRHARAEEAARPPAERFELVTSRAVAPLAVVAEYAAPLLAVGGTLVVWRGTRDPKAELEAQRAAAILGLEIGEIRRVVPYSGAQRRHLHLMSKVSETPSRFPRRAGMALKRPLGTEMRGRGSGDA